MSEAAAIESTVRARFAVVLDASATVVAACAAWIGVYAAVAPTVITKVWASLMADPNSDTDRRAGLLAAMHEALKNCARRGGSDDVIRQLVLSVRRDVPPAITSAIALEAEGSEFRRHVHNVVAVWRGFTGFFPAQWLDRTAASVANAAALAGGAKAGGGGRTDADAAANATGGGAGGAGSAGGAGGDGAGMIAGVAVDPLAAESSGLAQVLRLFQKYNAALERLRRFEADPSASAAAIESVRDDVVHRAQPLLKALGGQGGSFGFIPTIEQEIKRIQQSMQSGNVADDAADPLEDLFA